MTTTSPPVAVLGAAVALPRHRVSVEEAIGSGLVDGEAAERVGVASLPVAESGAPDLAVAAGRRALDLAGMSADSVGWVFHAWTYHQGHDFWSPSHYVADRVGARRATPVGIQQMCNGGAQSIALAAHALASDRNRVALITTADVFAAPGFDRWNGDAGIWYGDAGTALVLAPAQEHPGSTLVLSSASVPLSDFEGMHRGADAFTAAPRGAFAEIDVRRTKRAFFEHRGSSAFADAVVAATRTAVSTSLASAGIDPFDPALRAHYLPRVGRANVAKTYRPALEGFVGGEIVDAGRLTGHLGAGDAAASLAEALGSRRFERDSIIALYSAGAGFTVSCTVVKIGDNEPRVLEEDV